LKGLDVSLIIFSNDLYVVVVSADGVAGTAGIIISLSDIAAFRYSLDLSYKR
jgi:hypothetical protein